MSECDWCYKEVDKCMGIDHNGSWGVCGDCAFEHLQDEINTYYSLFGKEKKFNE